MRTVPILIIGGGVAGAAVACSLAERGRGSGVAVVDVDLFGKYSSSELNGGGVRATFAEAINIKLSLASLKYYQANASRFDFRQRGYLWMYDEKLWEESKAFLPLVKSFGLPVEELSRDDLKAKFPILDDVSDLAGATFTPMDGRLSPHRLRIHFLNHAQAGGVDLLDRRQVVAIEGDASPYRVTLRRVPPRGVKQSLTQPQSPANLDLVILAERIVNAAGPWAPSVAKLYGRELPVTPMPRQVFLLKHPTVNLEPLPFFIDYPQDIYFRYLEKNRQPLTLVSWSDPAEPHRIDFSYHSDAYFRQHVAPRLTKRIAATVDAQLVGGWVGHYELSPDKTAIVGPVTDRPGIFNLNGLSAHGVMQSRALGEAMAEHLLTGKWPADLNLDALNESRFVPGRTMSEKMYV